MTDNRVIRYEIQLQGLPCPGGSANPCQANSGCRLIDLNKWKVLGG